jgi:uncharacterized protein
MNVSEPILTALLHLLCVSPLFVIAYRQSKKLLINEMLFFVGLYILTMVLVYAPSPPFFKQFHWNWWGKILVIVSGLIFLLFQHKNRYPDYGFTTKLYENSFKPVVSVFVIMACLNGIMYVVEGFQGYKVETLLYQATMPGISEELFFRGIFLGFLNNSFGKPWTVFGAKMGWGVVITTLLFGLGHGLFVEKDFHIVFNILSIIGTGIIGFILAWSKERCGSIFPAIFGHNLFNSTASF